MTVTAISRLLGVLAICTLSFAQDASDEIVRAMQERRAAETRDDASQWETLVANDCLWVEPNGRIVGPDAHKPIAGKPNASVSSEVDLSEYEVHKGRDAAVLVYREEVNSSIGEKKLKTTVRFTEVYRRLANHWVLVNSTETPIVERAGITVNPVKFKDFVGEYEIAPGLVGIVALDGDKLTLFSKGWRKPYELVPLSENKFFVMEFETTEITFVRDEGGKITHHTSESSGQPTMVARKIR